MKDSDPSGPTILLLAGEASGDQHGAPVARELLRRWPNARLIGLGGPRMAEAGVDLLEGLDKLAVMGFAEVISRLPFFWKLERRVKALLPDVDLVLPIDYPGFNLRISRAAREAGVPVLFYIAPQVWAWKERRAEQLARDASRLAVILPFEVEVFEKVGADVHFVGHPLVEEAKPPPDRDRFCREVGVDPNRPLLALFPGSRAQELDRHLELFEETAHRVVEDRPSVQPVWACASGVDPDVFAGTDFPVAEDSEALLSRARAALAKSGTTTLQAALAEVPFATVYRTSPFTWFLAKRLVKVPHVALANLVAGREVSPEFLQDEATPERLAPTLIELLDDGSRRDEVRRGLGQVREALGTPGASRRVAELAVELLPDFPTAPTDGETGDGETGGERRVDHGA